MDFGGGGGHLYDELLAATAESLDELGFGVIGLDAEHRVAVYNATESRWSGLPPERVLGRHFFTEVAPCTNNFMVAHRFETEDVLDAVIDYVFTLRMRPTPVRLRLLRRPGAPLQYLLVDWS